MSGKSGHAHEVPGVLEWPVGIERIDQYAAQLTAFGYEWNKAHPGDLRVWFRGQPKIEWEPVPSLLRYASVARDLSSVEHNVRMRFQQRGTPWLKGLGGPLLDVIMQHHGVPTRYLDWTENALAALYFAIRDPEYFDKDVDAAVWVLEPLALASLAWGQRGIQAVGATYSGLLPRPVYAHSVTDRISAQHGTFTEHPFRAPSLFQLARDNLVEGSRVHPFLACMRINGRQRKYLREGLTKVFGVGEATLFPGLDGLAKELRQLEGLEGRG